MNFLFDNNLPPALAHSIAALSSPEPDIKQIVHITDLFAPATPDLTWITGLSSHGTDWYIVTQDKFRKSKGAEREALRRAGHATYVLDPSWVDHPFWIKAAQLVLWWPQVLQHARLTRGGVHRVPWRHSAKGKFESL